MVARSATLRRGLRSLLEEAGNVCIRGESSDLEWPLTVAIEVIVFASPLEPSWTRTDLFSGTCSSRGTPYPHSSKALRCCTLMPTRSS